jgi:hypothetical protein
MKKDGIEPLIHLLSFAILAASAVSVIFFRYSVVVCALAFVLSWTLVYVILPCLKKRWPR